ncbi:STAS domain-containing protein [Streptomyces marianii]|uniref:Anti-sigma factor antagonist n=1 Tax=Streptomyces marianii TaxID=1817406 RepID=A0A5R9DZR4_9ACTN|nr:STAS domain-containing protein [Streptomyces marianii]TLQ42299.1 STAS domain-containing protein [Streptomyces marianii]
MSEDLEVTATSVDGVRVVQAGGEFDADEAGTLAEALVTPFDGTALGVVADLSRVTFADSSFLHTLIEAHRCHTAAGVPFVLAQPHPTVQRLLDLTDTARFFTIAPTTTAALDEIRRARSNGHNVR